MHLLDRPHRRNLWLSRSYQVTRATYNLHHRWLRPTAEAVAFLATVAAILVSAGAL